MPKIHSREIEIRGIALDALSIIKKNGNDIKNPQKCFNEIIILLRDIIEEK